MKAKAVRIGAVVTAVLVALQVVLLLLPSNTDDGAEELSPLAPSVGEILLVIGSVALVFVVVTAIAAFVLRRKAAR